jgi:glycosyltransferase involved in cell wall biosynthesis
VKASSVRCHQCFPTVTPEMFRLREDWLRLCYGKVDAFITPTDFVKRRYVDWGLPAEKIFNVTNAQADYSLRDYRVKIGTGESGSHTPNRFGFFGQLVDNKGLGVVFDALQHYAKTYEEPIQLDINGANLKFGSEKFQARFAEFLESAKALEPVVRVAYLGSYSMSDLPARMSRVDWVLVPSIWWEIFGLVVSEAFMFRKPPICSNIGGMAERIAHDENGILFPVGDAIALAETLHRCVTEERLHARLAANSPGVPPVADVVAAHLEVYQAALGAR